MKRLFFLFALLTILFFPGRVAAKSYTVPAVSFTVYLNQDRSAQVTERRSYRFNGKFSWADRYIPLIQNQAITSISVADETGRFQESSSQQPGTFYTNVSAGKFYVKWFYQAQDTGKTFTLAYTINNASIKHQNISEFYWKLIGEDWQVETDNVVADIYTPLPVTNNQIYGYGHGPLNGQIIIPENNRVRFTASPLNPGTFFEVRVLFPADQLAGPADNKTLAEIKDEEQLFIAQTQRQIDDARELAMLTNRWLAVSATPFFLIGLLRIGWLTVRWWKYGKDKHLPQASLSGYLHEPPDNTPPALVSFLVDPTMNKLKPFFVSTLLSLVHKRIIKIVRVSRKRSVFDFLRQHPTGNRDTEYGVQLLQPLYLTRDDLLDLEKHLLNILFLRAAKNGGNTYDLDEEKIDDISITNKLNQQDKEYLQKLSKKQETLTFDRFKKYCQRSMAAYSAFKEWRRLISRYSVNQGLVTEQGNKEYWKLQAALENSSRRKGSTWLALVRLIMTIIYIALAVALFYAFVRLPEFDLVKEGLIFIGLTTPLVYAGFYWPKSYVERGKSDNLLEVLLILIVFLAIIFPISFSDVMNIDLMYLSATIASASLIFIIIFHVVKRLASSFMHQRTEKGRQTAARWIAFKKYLRDYLVTKHDPIDSLIIWEKYLIYGTALGVSAKALANIPVHFGTEDQERFTGYYGGGTELIRPVNFPVRLIRSLARWGISAAFRRDRLEHLESADRADFPAGVEAAVAGVEAELDKPVYF